MTGDDHRATFIENIKQKLYSDFSSVFAEYDKRSDQTFKDFSTLTDEAKFFAVLAYADMPKEAALREKMLVVVDKIQKVTETGTHCPEVKAVVNSVIAQWCEYKHFIKRNNEYDVGVLQLCSLNSDSIVEKVTFMSMFSTSNICWRQATANKTHINLELPIFCYPPNDDEHVCIESTVSAQVREIKANAHTMATAFMQFQDAVLKLIAAHILAIDNLQELNAVNRRLADYAALKSIFKTLAVRSNIFEDVNITTVEKSTTPTGLQPLPLFSFDTTSPKYSIADIKTDLSYSAVIILCGDYLAKIQACKQSLQDLTNHTSLAPLLDALNGHTQHVETTRTQAVSRVQAAYHTEARKLAEQELRDKKSFNAKYGILSDDRISNFIQHLNDSADTLLSNTEKEEDAYKRSIATGRAGTVYAEFTRLETEADGLLSGISASSLIISDKLRSQLLLRYTDAIEVIMKNIKHMKLIASDASPHIKQDVIDAAQVACDEIRAYTIQTDRDKTLLKATRGVKLYIRSQLLAYKLHAAATAIASEQEKEEERKRNERRRHEAVEKERKATEKRLDEEQKDQERIRKNAEEITRKRKATAILEGENRSKVAAIAIDKSTSVAKALQTKKAAKTHSKKPKKTINEEGYDTEPEKG